MKTSERGGLVLRGFRRIVGAISFSLLLLAPTLKAQGGIQSPPLMPTVTGPVPTTLNSHPFLAWQFANRQFNFDDVGYAEREYFISGKANVYNWAKDGSVAVQTPNVPYTTRILVRLPKDPAKFSGTVIVDIFNPAFGYDYDLMWTFMRDYLVASGDAYVGITGAPVQIKSLQKFDPVRYAPLTMQNPEWFKQTCPAATATSVGGVAPFTYVRSDATGEPGLLWDIISQVGVLARSNAPSTPFSGYRVQEVYYVGQTGGDSPLYVNAFADHVALPSGKPVYDGYVIKDSGSPGLINICAERVPLNDPRAPDKPPANAPLIRLLTQNTSFLQSTAWQLEEPDSDTPTSRYRFYEESGANEASYSAVLDSGLSSSDVTTMGMAMPLGCATGYINDFPQQYVVSAIIANLDAWVRTGKAPPHGTPITLVKRDGKPIGYDYDEYGNVKGGIRTPYLDVPVYTYTIGCPSGAQPASPSRGVINSGYKARFDEQRLHSLYPTHADYVKKVNQSVDELVKGGWLLPADGERIKNEAMHASVPD